MKTLVTVEVIDCPSNTKGWARYSVRSLRLNGPAITTTTGNMWVGKTTKTATLEQGDVIEVSSQVMLRVGKGRTARDETTTLKETYEVGSEARVMTLCHKPGSQGQTLRITFTPIAPAAAEQAMDDFDTQEP